MKQSGPIDLALGVLDHKLVDADRRRCGKVDDLELTGIADGRPEVAAILSGAAARRGPRSTARIRTHDVAESKGVVRAGPAGVVIRDRAERHEHT